jgi:hypothetical protein
LFASTAPTFLSRSNAESTLSTEGGSSVPPAGKKYGDFTYSLDLSTVQKASVMRCTQMAKMMKKSLVITCS